MAGLVIIDNSRNAVRQIGETAASWMLRTGAYAAANAINLAIQQGKRHQPKDYPLLPEHTWSVKSATLKEEHSGSDYSGMRFLQGGIPVNNLILKNKNNEFIEFVDAKIRVTKQNTIIETALVNRKGTIKEYIAARDYEIGIRGNIMVSENCYPTFEIGEINRFLSDPEEFDVVNTYLGTFGIAKVVFKTGDFDQQGQKFFNVLPFDFRFTSDNDAENAYGLIMDN